MFAKSATCCFKPYGVRNVSNLTTLKPYGGQILTLTMKAGNQHLLTADLLKYFRSDLEDAKNKASEGSVLITTAEGNVFCTGFSQHGYHEEVGLFKDLVKEFISLPMPTIAAINGPAINAGLILAMAHDHLTMEPNNRLLSMVHSGNKISFPDYFTAMIRSKVGPDAFSRLVSTDSTYDSEAAKQMGLAVHPQKENEENPLVTAVYLANLLSRNKWDVDHYPKKRKTLYPDLCKVLELSSAPS